MILMPTEPGEGYSFESRVVGGSVPKEYIPGVEKGINSVMDYGPLAGFPVIDFKVALIDGKFHDVDSSVLAFEIAARMGMREGMKKAGAKLLEPIMKVEVITPEEYTGGIIGDLTSRRGQVQVRTHVATRSRSTHLCLWRTCLATSTHCAPCLRAVRSLRCSSTTTSQCQATSRTKFRRNSLDLKHRGRATRPQQTNKEPHHG